MIENEFVNVRLTQRWVDMLDEINEYYERDERRIEWQEKNITKSVELTRSIGNE